MDIHVLNIPFDEKYVVMWTAEDDFSDFQDKVLSEVGDTKMRKDDFELIVGGEVMTKNNFPDIIIGNTEIEVQLSPKGQAVLHVRQAYGDKTPDENMMMKSLKEDKIEIFISILQLGVPFTHAILYIIKNDNGDIIKMLINNQLLNINKQSYLLSAVNSNSVNVVKVLLSNMSEQYKVEVFESLDQPFLTFTDSLSMIQTILENSGESHDFLLNKKDVLGKSTLVRSIERNLLDVAEYLLSLGATVCSRCMDAAAVNCDPSILRQLINHGGDPSDAVGGCCVHGESELLSFLLQKGASVTTTQLLFAVGTNVETVRLFVSYFSSNDDHRDTYLDTVDNEKRSLLRITLVKDKLNIAEYLLENGVDPLKECNIDVFRLALLRGRLDFAKLIYRYGGEQIVNQPNVNGITALSRASYEGKSEVVDFLVNEVKADVNISGGKYNDLPLHRAAHAGHVEVIKILLSAGSLINTTNGKGYTPLLVAAEARHTEAVLILLENGADPNVQHIDYCLQCIVSKHYYVIARHLIRFGAPADSFIRDKVCGK